VRLRFSRESFAKLLKSIACFAAALTASVSLAQEPLPITIRGKAQAPRVAGKGNVTFPSTSAAPIRWKGQAGTATTMHLDDVEHTPAPTASSSASGIKFGPATPLNEPAEIRPIQFTLQLDGPRNGAEREVQPAAGIANRKPAGASEGAPAKLDSVLSSRRKAPPATRVKPAPVESEPPASFAGPDEEDAKPIEAKPIDGDELILQGEGKPLQITDDEDGPPQPAIDPDDAAPSVPESLQLRPAPQQFIQQAQPEPSDNPRTRDPARTALPPVATTKKRRCNNPNDRDCCADEQNCSDQLQRLIVQDKLFRQGKEQLDITPRWEPNEKEGEHERNEERRQQQFRLAGKREFQDKDGKVLGEGTLVTLALGKAIIETESGENVELDLRRLSDDDLCFIAAWYRLPTECTLGNEQFEQRQFIASTMTWHASGVCHKPLYFEDVQLERYGHTRGPVVQTAVSSAHFFANVALLPYKMGINPPYECQYPLGYYRPGSCAPWMMQPFPLSARGALSATGFYTGANFLIP
jgi:hypothetical protein